MLIPGVVLFLLVVSDLNPGEASIALLFGMLTVCGRKLAKLRWKHAMVLAAIHTAVQLVLNVAVLLVADVDEPS